MAIKPPPPYPVENEICFNCSHFNTGWHHPTCSNIESPNNGKSIKDQDTCEVFASKHGIKPVVSRPKSSSKTKTKSKLDPNSIDV